jgi:hypothetical protein
MCELLHLLRPGAWLCTLLALCRVSQHGTVSEEIQEAAFPDLARMDTSKPSRSAPSVRWGPVQVQHSQAPAYAAVLQSILLLVAETQQLAQAVSAAGWAAVPF